MAVHLIAYTAHTANGTEQGVARVRSDRSRPSWKECHEQIDGYFTGKYLGIETQYTLKYRMQSGLQTKTVGPGGVQIVGKVIMNLADRGEAWDIEVLDADGNDVTFDFACFRD